MASPVGEQQTVFSLDGSDWEVSGWWRHSWRQVTDVVHSPQDLSSHIKPVVPWIPATVPGAVQLDLQAAGYLPPDLNVDLDSLAAEWVNNREWIYRKSFHLPGGWERRSDGERVLLHFEGLDHWGEIHLNGTPLADFNGMFKPVTVDITEHLSEQQPNHLVVIFYQTPEVDGQHGYTSKIDIIKSRFNYNWDWCTRIVPVGFWDTVFLQRTGDVRITDFWPRAVLQDDNRTGALTLTCELEAAAAGPCELEWTVRFADEPVLRGTEITQVVTGANRWSKQLIIDSVHPWWPQGHGDQPLYDVAVTLRRGGSLSDSQARRVGFKRLRFVTNPGAPHSALPYTAYVNGRRIFLQGVNWVPISPLYGAVQREDYVRYVGRFRDMGCNMLRVWGGAILEKEAFYDVCDEMGLLVWQELFQSSSGIDNEPSADPAFIKELVEVAEVSIRRRRHHVSHAMWCGGNELVMIEGFRPADENHPNLKLLGRTARDLDPDKHYFATSPSGPNFSADETRFGQGVHHDVHGPWTYLGPTQHYRYFNGDDALIRTEVGTPSCSSLETLVSLAKTMPLWPPVKENRLWLHHGAWWIQWDEMNSLFGGWAEDRDELPLYVKASQLLQLESVRYAAESVRRREPQTSGFLLWMGNEPFANTANTAVVEHNGRTKPAYSVLREVFSQMHASLKYDAIGYRSGEGFRAEVYLHSDQLERVSSPVSVTASCLNIHGELLATTEWRLRPSPGDGPVFLGVIEWAVVPLPSQVLFVHLDVQGPSTSTTNTYMFSIDADPPLAPFRYLPQTYIKVEHVSASHGSTHTLELVNTSSVAACMVHVSDHPTNRWSDIYPNAFTLFPGERREVAVRTQTGRPRGQSTWRVSALNGEDVLISV